MRKSVGQNPFTILFFFYLLAFGGFFFYSIFAFPGYLAIFQWPFVWTNSFLLFMRYSVPVTVAAVAAAYSLLPTAETVRIRSGKQPFSRLVSSHLTTFIVLTVLYTVLILGLHPLAHRNMERFDSLTREARVFRERADRALEDGDRREALHNYQRYLAIDENNRAVMERTADLQREMISGSPETSGNRQEVLQTGRIGEPNEGQDPLHLYQMAEEFYDGEDYFSAHYYSTLAYRIDPDRRDARRLAARSLEKIAGKDLNKLEVEEKRLYERKRQGYEYFVNEQYLEAYHVFRELQQSHPQDPDVLSYLQKSEERLSMETFFLDEAEEIDTLPGMTELLFVNSSDGDEREIVFIGKVAGVEAGVFCSDIEVLRFTPRGVLYHYLAEYGRLHDRTINLHGIDRDSAQRQTVPRYLSGAGRLRHEHLPYMLSLGPSLEQLPGLQAGKGISAADSLGFFSLWQARRWIASYGYVESFLSAEILRRLLLPFSFLVLCLFSVAVGWRFQARFPGRPNRILLVFLPLFPVLAIPLTGLYVHAQRIILAFVLLRFGFSISLTVLLVLQGVLLLTSMVILAGQQVE